MGRASVTSGAHVTVGPEVAVSPTGLMLRALHHIRLLAWPNRWAGRESREHKGVALRRSTWQVRTFREHVMRSRWYEDRALSRRARARDAGMGMGTAYLGIWRHAEPPNGSFELTMMTKLRLVATISSLVGPLDCYLNRFGRCGALP